MPAFTAHLLSVPRVASLLVREVIAESLDFWIPFHGAFCEGFESLQYKQSYESLRIHSRTFEARTRGGEIVLDLSAPQSLPLVRPSTPLSDQFGLV